MYSTPHKQRMVDLCLDYSKAMKGSQRSNVRRVRSVHHNFAKKNTKVESFTLTAKRNAFSENLSFLDWGQGVFSKWNKCHPQVLSARNSVSRTSYVYRFRTNFPLVKRLNWSNFKALKNRQWRCFLRLTAVKMKGWRGMKLWWGLRGMLGRTKEKCGRSLLGSDWKRVW